MIRVFGSVAFDTVGLVAQLPAPDTTARVERLATRFGGAGGNVAYALGRLGAAPALATAVGPDFAGSGYEARLKDAGVDLEDVRAAPEPTAHAYVWTAADGRQQTYFFPGASRRLDLVPVRDAPLAHFSAGEIAAYPTHMRAARTVTFDPGQETFHRPLAEVAACLPETDVLFVNEHELARLESGLGFGDKAAWDLGMGAIVVTRGAAGAEVRTPDGVEVVPALPAQAVDPTGAGDAHRAGFLVGLARGLPLGACARLGAACAAFAVESLGPQEGVPTLAELRARHERAFGAWPL